MARNALRALGIRELAALALLLGGLPSSAAALPFISEVFYDATGSDDGKSFVELYGTPGTLLDGMRLEGVNGAGGAIGPVLALSGAIPADGFFVVADDLAGGPTPVANADLVLNFDFQNGPDSIVLHSSDAVLDAVGYGVFAPGDVFAGEGSPAPGVGVASTAKSSALSSVSTSARILARLASAGASGAGDPSPAKTSSGAKTP